MATPNYCRVAYRDLVVTKTVIYAVISINLLIWGFGIYAIVRACRAVRKRSRGWIGDTISGVLTWLGAWTVGVGANFTGTAPLIFNISVLFAGSFLIGL